MNCIYYGHESEMVFIYIYDLVPKGAQMGGQMFDNKIRFKHFVLLLLCVCS